jgi:rapamycin-insensitive companion of mTOR
MVYISVSPAYQLGLVDIDRLMQTDAFRVVLLVFKDGPSELGTSVAALLAFLANFPHTRHRLVPGSDLEVSSFL